MGKGLVILCFYTRMQGLCILLINFIILHNEFYCLLYKKVIVNFTVMI